MVNFMTSNSYHSHNTPPLARVDRLPAAVKKTLSVGAPLHSLVRYLSSEYNLSYEQVVSKAVIEYAKTSPVGSAFRDNRWALTKTADNEVKARYLGTQSKRSANMRRVNNARRRTRLQQLPYPI
jgi:hypothetical protein